MLRILFRLVVSFAPFVLISSGVSPAVASDEPVIRVVSARYVAPNGNSCDFTNKVSCSGRTCTVGISNGLCGDPQNQKVKKGYIAYTCNWSATATTLPGSQFLLRPFKKFVTADEGAQATLQCTGENPVPVHKPVLSSITAKYYDPGNPRLACDFTKFASAMCEGATSCTLPADNSLCGDPSGERRKAAEIFYRCRYAWSPSALPAPPAPPSVERRSADEGGTVTISCD